MENYFETLDSAFRALADPTRRAIVQRLGSSDAPVGVLAAPFGMGLPSFLKHISILEEAGLIRTVKEGRIRTCSLQGERLAVLENWFGQQRQLWKGRHDNLDSLLAILKGDRDHET